MALDDLLIVKMLIPFGFREFGITLDYSPDRSQFIGVEFTGFHKQNWFEYKFCRFVSLFDMYVLREMVIAVKEKPVPILDQNCWHKNGLVA